VKNAGGDDCDVVADEISLTFVTLGGHGSFTCWSASCNQYDSDQSLPFSLWPTVVQRANKQFHEE
jgi:hypothetical protein